MKTRDIDIREKLHNEFQKKYSYDLDTLIVDELNLCQGVARIDLAVINGCFHGYEIKSESDNLLRLPNQIDVYNKVMDKMTVITGENHYEKVAKLVPEWWGIKVVVHGKRSIKIVTKKRAKKNKEVNAYSIAQLLWKDEAINILESKGLEKGFKSKPKRVIWERLASSLSLEELQFEVREALKNRKGWRVDQQQKQYDD